MSAEEQMKLFEMYEEREHRPSGGDGELASPAQQSRSVSVVKMRAVMDRASESSPTDTIRPVQYLGNKQRSLEIILAAAPEAMASQPRVADLFSGTSVVSQGFAHKGRPVVASDISPACVSIATATLGVGRRAEANDSTATLDAWFTRGRATQDRLAMPVRSLLKRAADALAAGDGAAVALADAELPLVWRTHAETFWKPSDCSSGHLLSPVFAGTYLGLDQCLQLDALRLTAQEMLDSGEIDRWTFSAMVTSLLSAASAAVFSPGKHFAQSHRMDANKDLRFHHQRLIQDRSVSVIEVTTQMLAELFDSGVNAAGTHTVDTRPVENWSVQDLIDNGVGLVYADPPYTAQQYSRFYHLLDTVATGMMQPLQLVDGRVTRGLYPQDRYLSPFCSRRQAPAAFEHLVSITRHAGASLMLSYSLSRTAGNARMIELDDLLAIVERRYLSENIEVLLFDHQYRQFNANSNARSGRDTGEVLVTAHVA